MVNGVPERRYPWNLHGNRAYVATDGRLAVVRFKSGLRQWQRRRWRVFEGTPRILDVTDSFTAVLLERVTASREWRAGHGIGLQIAGDVVVNFAPEGPEPGEPPPGVLDFGKFEMGNDVAPDCVRPLWTSAGVLMEGASLYPVIR